MDKSVKSKNAKFIIIVSVFIIIGVIVFTLITTKVNPFKGLVGTIVGDEVKSIKNDNYNGFYTKKDLLDSTYRVFSGCSVYSIDNIILVYNEDYVVYRSSCMGTYVKDKGKTRDLIIETDKDKYVIKYKDNDYKKDTTVKSVVENNIISKNMYKTTLAAFPVIVKETEFEGNYYDISADVTDVEGQVKLSYNRDNSSKSFSLSLTYGILNNVTFYRKDIKDGENLPLMYGVGKSIVVIEPDYNTNAYNYSFKAYVEGDLKYDLSQQFPIKINGEVLNYGSHSVYIKYNPKNKDFTMFVGNDKKFCVENSNSAKVASYIFKLKYNYNTNTFDNPEYIKSIKGADGCSEIESYMGD